eukprot:scaffold168955_cov48-Attheya_sp.AAC.1
MSPEGEGEPSLPKLLAALALGAHAVNGLPMGKSGGDENDGSDHDDDDDEEDGMAEDEFAYQSAFPEFSSLCGTARHELAQLLQLVLDMENDASNNDDAAMWENVLSTEMPCNDDQDYDNHNDEEEGEENDESGDENTIPKSMSSIVSACAAWPGPTYGTCSLERYNGLASREANKEMHAYGKLILGFDREDGISSSSVIMVHSDIPHSHHWTDHDNEHARHFFTHPHKRRRKKGRLHRNGLGNHQPETNQRQTAPKDNHETHDGSHDQARSILLEEPTRKNENHENANHMEDDTSKKKKKRPNILFLYADDWRHDTLGCAGNPVVQTPYLADGIRFTHNMVTTSVCWISRVSLLTGQYVTKENEKQALRFLKSPNRPRDRPFYLGVQFFATHAEDSSEGQYFPQAQSSSTLYVNDTIPVPPTAGDEYYAKMPYFFDEFNEGRVRYKWRYDTFEKQQRMMKNMYRMATEVDTTIGAILKELYQQDELSNT